MKWCSIGLTGLEIYKEYLITFLLKFYSIFFLWISKSNSPTKTKMLVRFGFTEPFFNKDKASPPLIINDKLK